MKEKKIKKPVAHLRKQAGPPKSESFGGKSLLFIIICGMVLIVSPLIVKAQTITIPDPLQGKEIIDIIDSVMSLLVVIGSGVGVIMVIWAGIQYMTAGGSEERVRTAKKTIMWAIIGVAILWSANFIIDAIKYLLQGL